MTDLMNRAAASAGKKAAKKVGKKVALSLMGTTTFWIVLAAALFFLVVAAAGANQAATTGTNNAITMTGGGGQVTAPVGADATIVHAAQIVNVAYGRGLGQNAAIIGVTVALAESNLYNYANDGTSTQLGQFADGHRQLNDAQRAVARESLNFAHERVGHDLDSMGLFQQRPSASWGTPAELMDPSIAAGKFYDALMKVAGWQSMTPATAAQTVQGSNDASGGIYAQTYAQAAAIVAKLGAPATAGGTGGVVAVPVNGVQVPLPANAGLAGVINAPTPTVAKAIAAGLAWIGQPYSWGGGSDTGPTLGICGPNGAENDCHITGFDCSGLTMYMWAQVGVHLSHFTADQWAQSTQIPYAQRLPGDMIGYEGHITVYLGAFNGVDMQLEAPYSGAFVRVSAVRDGHHPNVYRVWQGK